ncbi:MAG: endo-1,4-beta-xylanase [Opitutaceae bacterium]|nr:endo-1,4-beta-xylanase [Opitutaceae bacterium]
MRLLSRSLALLLAAVATGPALSAAPLAAGKPKFLGGIHSTAQAVGLLDTWNQITPENAGKWGSVESTRDVMNWTQLDAAYALAKDNGLPFRFHILIWGNQQPAWIASLPAAEQLEEIQEWYAAVAVRYPDIDYLEVVNEPISDAPDGLPGRFDAPGSVDPNDGAYIAALGGAGTTGWDWVLNAFRLARAAFPNTPLVMHDYSLVNNTTTLNRFLEIVTLLKAEGLVDIIGEQAHSFTIATMQANTLTTNLTLMASAGLPIMITEMDIDGADSTTVNDTTQLDRYQRLFPALWEHPAVMGITTWGYRPGMWRANAVLVLSDGTDRSAMTWLRSYVADSNPPLRPTFVRSPASLTRNAGQSATFSVPVLGNPAPTLRWQVSTNGTSWNDLADDATYSGTTTATLTIGTTTAAMNGHRFRLSGTNTSGTLTTPYPATLTVNEPPVITGQPASTTQTAGGSATFAVAATGAELTYQWKKDGVAVAGAMAATLTIPSVQAWHAGAYTVTVTNTFGTVTSDAATLTVDAAALSDARLLNLSTRALCQTGDNVLIPGFYIEGAGTKRLLMRAVGPELTRFGVASPLPDPVMVLKRFDATADAYVDVATNDNWGDNANWQEIRDTAASLYAFSLTTGSNSAALLMDLSAGGYTIVASGKGDSTGVSIVELYEANGDAEATRLVNISNRGFVGVGSEIMIPGFVVSDSGPRTFLVRAVGPTLARFGITGFLPDPWFEIYKRRPGTATDDLLLTNDTWGENGDTETLRQAALTVRAFRLNDGSTDAALVVTLPPGSYTVNAKGKDSGTGVALVEVYLMP